MPLFTDPIVLNDGSNDRSFTFRAQLNDSKQIIGEWIEPAANLSEQSSFFVKHDESKPTVHRRLFQRSAYLPVTDGSLKRCTVNVTITHHPEHSLADITKQVKLTQDGMAEATFINNFLQGLI